MLSFAFHQFMCEEPFTKDRLESWDKNKIQKSCPESYFFKKAHFYFPIHMVDTFQMRQHVQGVVIQARDPSFDQ